MPIVTSRFYMVLLVTPLPIASTCFSVVSTCFYLFSNRFYSFLSVSRFSGLRFWGTCPRFFLAGISWVKIFFSWVFRWRIWELSDHNFKKDRYTASISGLLHVMFLMLLVTETIICVNQASSTGKRLPLFSVRVLTLSFGSE